MRGCALSVIALSCLIVSARADDMKAAVSAGVLTIKDSPSDDTLKIDQVGLLDPTAFRLTPSAGTTVNGSASAQILAGVTKDVRLMHAGGVDEILIDHATMPRDLLAKVANQSTFELICEGAIIGRDVKVDCKADLFAFNAANNDGAVVKRDVKISAPLTTASFGFLGQLRVLRNLSWKGSPGDDGIGIADIALIGGAVQLDLGGGNDTVGTTVNTHCGKTFKVKGKSGTKQITFGGVHEGAVALDLGASTATVTVGAVAIQGAFQCKVGSGGQLDADFVGATIGQGVDIQSKGTTDTVLFDQAEIGGDARFKLGPGTNIVQISNVSTVGGDLFYFGSSASDDLGFSGSTVFGDAVIQLGSAPAGQEDAVSGILNSFFGDLRITGTGGDHGGGIEDTGCLGEFKLNYGSGANSFVLDGGSFKAVTLIGTSGSDQFIVTGGSTKVHGGITAQLGDGNNTMTVANTTCWGNLGIKAGNGDDVLSVTAVTVFGDSLFDLGGGNNVGP
jgi:hypothetical protein